MAYPKIYEPEAPTTNEALDALEARLGIKLVPAHRAWLLQYNGGRPSPNKFRRKDADGGPYTDGVVAWFLAVYDGRAENLGLTFRSVHQHAERMPSDLMPIARDPFGNYICIAFRGPNLGKIYFWDHEEELDAPDDHGEPSYDNCHLIADTFDEFINGLHNG